MDMTDEQITKAREYAVRRYTDDEDCVVVDTASPLDDEDPTCGVWIPAWVWVPARAYQGENE